MADTEGVLEPVLVLLGVPESELVFVDVCDDVLDGVGVLERVREEVIEEDAVLLGVFVLLGVPEDVNDGVGVGEDVFVIVLVREPVELGEEVCVVDIVGD